MVLHVVVGGVVLIFAFSLLDLMELAVFYVKNISIRQNIKYDIQERFVITGVIGLILAMFIFILMKLGLL